MLERFFLATSLLVALMGAEGYFLASPRIRTSLFRSVTPDIGAVSVDRNTIDGEYCFEHWAKAFVSQPEEFDYVVDDIEGLFPADLPSGALFRNMPSLFERGGVDYGHYLDGDGYVAKLTIDSENNSARFQSSFVKTEEYKKENEAERILFRSTFRTQKGKSNQDQDQFKQWLPFDPANAFDLTLKNLANTNVVSWGGKLLALFEAGVPYVLDPQSLDTLGTFGMNLSPPLSVSLGLRLKGLFFLYRWCLFNVEWCIRQLWCSSIIIYNITSIAYNHYTDIYPHLNI